MNKIILTFSIALLTVVGVHAQISYGVKGGVNFASILNESNKGVKGRTSFNAGVMAEIETSPVTSVQVEVLYSGQGFKYEGGIIEGISVAKDTYALNYLNIPVLFKYYINDEFSFEVGPQVGFLLSSKAETTGEKVNDYFTNASFDVAIGFGYKFENGLYLDARYNFGITNIWKGPVLIPDYPYYYEYGKTNGVVQLSVGFYLDD